MPSYSLIPKHPQCPYLPEITDVIRPSELKDLKNGKNREAYYLQTLRCGQSLWLCGLPAQSLLQLNHALGEDLPENADVPP